MPRDDPQLADMLRTSIYRSAPPSQTGHLLVTPAGDRRPKHVPNAVDNVWEWARPSGFPSRRSSAFGSPTPALARHHGPANSTACHVWVVPPWRAAQIPGVADAKDHPDVAAVVAFVSALPSEVERELGVPLLPAEVVGEILGTLDQAVVALQEIVNLWRHADAMDAPVPSPTDPTGELFFEAPHGYVLVPVADVDQ